MRKGSKMTDEQRKRLSEAHIGQKAWNKDIKTGLVPKTAFKKGHKPSQNWVNKFQDGKIGFQKNYIPWNKGLPSDKQPSWRGGRQKSGNGYIYLLIPNHPFADKRGRVFEHRYLMEQKIGRYLRKDEIVDHINEITNDNRIENLQIVTHGRNLKLSYERKKAKLNE